MKTRISILAAVLLAVIGLVGSASSAAAAPSGPYLVVSDLHFLEIGGTAEGCDFLGAELTNLGNVTQPSGWSWTVEIPKLGLTHTFGGQNAVAPGETVFLFHNPGPFRRGRTW